MLSGLMLTAFLMGVGGIPHCAAMCGSACAVAFPKGVPWLALLGRCVGYALLGALAAASASLIAGWGRHVSILQPFWVMVQAMAVLMGLMLLIKGRMPRALDLAGQSIYRQLRSRARMAFTTSTSQRYGPVIPLLAGMAWATLPCGLLYAALMLAVLAPGLWEGALVMACFALPGALGVWATPALLSWLSARRAGPTGPSAVSQEAALGNATAIAPVIWLVKDGVQSGNIAAPFATASTWLDPRWAIRVSGVCLSSMALWGLSHHLVAQWQAWCA